MNNQKNYLNGFQTLWIRFDTKTADKHQLFFKEHSIRNQAPEHPRGKTLFVLNVPPYVTPDVLQKTFSDLCGTVSNVYYTTPNGFKVAYIVFEKEFALERALEILNDQVITLNTESCVCVTGLSKWCKDYNDSICDETKMKVEIETYMQNYDKRVLAKIKKEKAMEENAEDGWVTVTGRKKRGQFALSRKETVINKVQQKEEQKNKKKQLLNFYTFQIRESKKQNLAELRKKFELDKKRLQDLKSKRTFRPF